MSDSESSILQGTLDLVVLKTLEHLGPLDGYGIALRIEQVGERALIVNQGTVYLCLVRLVQKKWIRAHLGRVRQQPQGQVLFPDDDRSQATAGRD
jgi:PadR family transcriptional regulator PadR